MPFCSQCAHALPEDSRFCQACGAPVVPAAPSRSASDLTKTSAQETVRAESGGPSARFESGTKLGSRYRVVALLGRGGMGEVYRADDLELGQSVALKFLPESLARSAEELSRFRGEVRVARQIAHPNVCRVYDIGEADGHVFLSMEYIDGEDLASVLRRLGRPSSEKAMEIARQICLGLAAAHESGMLHRDLKPANIMIDGRGRVRITDFGLAGLADELAREVGVVGTPAYMAPEQLAGGRVSVRSDLYALGLVLYEIFTGKRVFSSTNIAELKQMHESGSVTTPSSLVRDLDPAVERVVLRCLEKDPELRPPSAYAVLGGLPGGDPLAAAMAAGETPSPELVANAADRGSLSPLAAMACVAGGLIGIAIWAGVLSPGFRELTQPTQILSVRATDILEKTGSFDELPGHTAEGFDRNYAHLEHLRENKEKRADGRSAIYFWRRWSPRSLQASSIHSEVVYVNDPPLLATGQARVLLDPEGRLVGLESFPSDTLLAAPARTLDWNVLFEAAGLDPATFAPAALVRPIPATCDSSAAWTGPLPWANAEAVTLQAGASRGRLVYFTVVHDWGASTAPLELSAEEPVTALHWSDFLLFTLLSGAASVYFATRNLRLGRGDRKGATRIAVFVFVMNILESAFTTRLSEDGLLSVGMDWMNGFAFGHSLMHAVVMWFAYVALEPYVRRLWPRLLVSWARLVSGRPRDPLVGRDLLIGGVAGIVMMAASAVVHFAAVRFGSGTVSPLVSSSMLASVASLANTGFGLAYGGSVCVLDSLNILVLVLVLRLLLQRTWPAVLIAALLRAGSMVFAGAATEGWLVVGLNALIFYGGGIFLVMRFGLLAGATGAFVTIVLGAAVATLDLSSWYANRALVPMALLVGILIYGAAHALAGKSIFGDPLKDAPGR
ncbi:MAG: serine/threonine-protein kinase [bacterium]